MTLNDLERRNSPYFAFFLQNSIEFQADYLFFMNVVQWLKIDL